MMTTPQGDASQPQSNPIRAPQLQYALRGEPVQQRLWNQPHFEVPNPAYRGPR